MRTGWKKAEEDVKRKRRRYRLHYQLKKNGNSVFAYTRTIIKRQRDLTEVENKYLAELAGYGYGITDKLF
jgi:hypothetical protein